MNKSVNVCKITCTLKSFATRVFQTSAYYLSNIHVHSYGPRQSTPVCTALAAAERIPQPFGLNKPINSNSICDAYTYTLNITHIHKYPFPITLYITLCKSN